MTPIDLAKPQSEADLSIALIGAIVLGIAVTWVLLRTLPTVKGWLWNIWNNVTENDQ